MHWPILCVIAACSSVPALAIAAPEAETKAAQGSTEKRADLADEHYKKGVEAYSGERYKDAIESFRAADALVRSPALSFNIALAYDKLLDTAGALAHYREYLRRDPKAQRAEKIADRIRELEGLLAARGVQQVTVQSEPSGATLVIDRLPVGVTPWTGELAPGPHDLVLRLPGFFDSVQRVNLALDRAVAFDFRLNDTGDTRIETPAEASEASPMAIDDRRPPSQSRGPSPWPWVAFGAGTASLLTAGTFELLREGAERKAKSQTTQIEYGRALHDAETHQRNARIFAGIGGGLAITGVVLLVALRPETQEPRSAAFTCYTDGCFGSLSAEF